VLGPLITFGTEGDEEVGTPCIGSPDVAKCDEPFKLSLWSRVSITRWRMRNELACARPL
jgi:hypothetical protein